MQLPSEIEAKYVLPALRAFIAKKLILEKGYTQEKAAEAVGVTQAAISNYLRGTRGFKIEWENNPIVLKYVDEIVEMIMRKAESREITKKLNLMLVDLRRKGILCELHKNVEPLINIDNCTICSE
ncbi:MAG: helix-turn-helix domain-containing protein [Aigarchaeota archaeon]|nr:helix-turn-helix domain-containing protein [Aigarchaeota archaeon]MCX8193361.1 helix-turn-helix domain-containing protein [Nitrososphaeria archaeon]MDW7985891.1 helix-turn-helix domain-containing protein [Nitrososphaerota archaeon]